MKKYSSPRWWDLARNTGLVKLGLLCLASVLAGNVWAAPANDNFSSATVISGVPGTTSGSNVGATIEAGEPTLGFVGASVWYQWTAPATGSYTFDTIGSTFDTVLEVYTGTSVSSLTFIAANDDIGFGNLRSRVTFPATAGQTYQIAVGGWQGAVGNIVLNWSVAVSPSNDNFAAATVLTGTAGITNGDNSLGSAEPNEPSHAGFAASHSSWYQWTAPQDGDVALDTLGSDFNTVLAVYTGTSLSHLSQVAANDDLYPQPLGNISAQNLYITNIPNAFSSNAAVAAWGLVGYNQPYSGPSGLHFNAVANTTYYFAVDGRSGQGGAYSLSWAYHPSGVFRFATENVDQTGITDANGNPMLLYQCAETEGVTPVGEFGNIDAETVIHTYYNYNNPGMLVTITRVAGSSGRVTVDYTTVDGDPNQVDNGDAPAVGGVDYAPVSGTLVFDDFEMSKTILIPIFAHTSPGAAVLSAYQPNRDFTVVLSNPQIEGNVDAPFISTPRVDSVFGQALVRILDVDIDPKGASKIVIVSTNGFLDPPTNTVPNLVTNTFYSTVPTNAVLNFQKANYRVARDVSNWWGGTPVTVYVNRYGTNAGGATCNWRVNNYFGQLQSGYDQQNQRFPLQPGSDYATPDPSIDNPLIMHSVPPDNADFISVNSGSLSWGSKDFRPKAIHFTVYNNGLSQFNEDLHIMLYIPDPVDSTIARPVGMVPEATVTILYDDAHPPAGSVDERYNPDYNTRLEMPVIPFSLPAGNHHPGADSEVYGLAVLTNDETVIVGGFSSYNGFTRNGIALIHTDGTLDTSFNPSSGGANDFINAVAVSGNQFVIGGGFTSFNGSARKGIARVNANGSIDNTFLNGLAGAEIVPGQAGTVWTLAVQPDGKVLIGGDFNYVNGTPRSHLARLNTNGSLDVTFNPGTNFNGTVYALALQSAGGTGQIFVGGDFAVGGQLYDNIALVNSDGSLNTSFNPGTGPDNSVFALCWQPNGQILLGGAFTHINGNSLNGLVRLNADGTVDATGFFPGTGADDTVDSIIYTTNTITALVVTNSGSTSVTNVLSSSNEVIYVGGNFTSFNGTHRLGFTRLYTDGTVDTTFLDTAYNQFAGLPQIYFSDSPGAVFAAGVQSDGNVMIAGSFQQVGGGQADSIIRNGDCADRGIPQSFADPNLWVSENRANIEPKTRDGVRNRNNVARLIGGSVNGAASLVAPANAYAPGNVGMVYDSYSINESDSARNVELTRANGALGPARANFAVQPGLAEPGVDYVYNANAPLYWITWENTTLQTRMHSHGLFGTNGVMEDIYGRSIWEAINQIAGLADVQVTVHPNPTIRGNLNATFQMANPSQVDQFYLGGENIPLGVALGRSIAPFTLIDDNKQSGQFGFTAPTFVAASTNADIFVVRSNGTVGQVNLKYSTADGTAHAPADYTAILPPQNMRFNNGGALTNDFIVTIKNNGIIYTNVVEKYFYVILSSLSGPSGNIVSYGISNAVVRLINVNYKGYLSFSAANYTGNESAGVVTFVVNRTSGSLGALSVQYATTNGTALNGVDYVGSTNTLNWASGDVSPRIVNIPLINTLTVGANKQFGVYLRNPTNNGAADPALMGLITNATLTINNDNSYGTLQLSAPNYFVNENGGYATITVIRTGGVAGSVSVHFATANGPNAFSGTNYIGTNGVLTFAPNQIAASFNVLILDDGVQDPANFYFNVNLSSPVNAALGSPASATVAILDAESFFQPPGSPGTGTNTIAIADNDVLALALQTNGQILIGGDFTAVNSVPENRIARLNADGTLDTTFMDGLSGEIGANGSVKTIACQSDGRILVGGSFPSMNGIFLSGLARLMTDSSLDTSFNPGSSADNTVYTMAESLFGGVRKIYVGGAFGTINSIPCPGIARLNNDGTVDNSFVTGFGADGTVYAVAVYPTNSVYAGKVLIGGAFTHYNGVSVNRIVRLNADGSVDLTFNTGLGAGGTVHAIAIQLDGRLLVGGEFITFNGVSLNRLARLNADGSLDASFTAGIGTGVDNTVEGIALQPDNRIVLVGLFTAVNGLTYNRIARLLPTGVVDGTISFGSGANAEVSTVVIQPADGMIVIGGAFTQYNGQPYDHLARLYGGSAGGSIASGNSLVIPAGSALISESFTPHNNIIESNETVTLSFAFRVASGNDATNLVAALLVTNGITAPSGPQSYGPLTVGGPPVSRQFSFTAHGTNGQIIAATFQLMNGTNNLGLGVFNYLLGTLTNTFANTNPIIINDGTMASPYPSVINVSGVGGTLIKATVTFTKLTHTWPADIDALVQSPSQLSALFMANAGGGNPLSGATLTFDDGASTSLPQGGQIVSGTFKPTVYTPISLFPTPAQSAPYATNLSNVYAGNPNGGWSLFVIDDQMVNNGVISNGWSLTLITATPIPTPPPQFTSIVYTNGTFQLSITSPAGSTVIQASTNLVNWVPIYTNYTSPFTYTDSNVLSYSNRFYRAVAVPGP